MNRKRKWTLAGVLIVLAAVSLLALWWRPRARFNLLIVTLDTTRADRLGCYGYGNARTPVLDSLAANGVLFENAYATAPLTLPSHASIFTGLQPPEHGLLTNGAGRLDPDIPTLAGILNGRGYRTGAFIGAIVLDAKFGLNRGFDTYDDDLVESGIGDFHSHRQRSGRLVVDSALAWLNKLDAQQPFCCWVHLYDPHKPYLTHEDELGPQEGSDPYDAEIAFVDRQIGRLVDHLQARGLARNTLVLVIGDHGEGLGEHHEPTHGSQLYNSTLRVPWIFSLPGVLPAGRRVAAPVSQIDVLPTVLDGLRVPCPQSVSGRSLKGAWQGQPLKPVACYALSEEAFLENGWSPLRSLTTESWKYIHTTRRELYDLTNDPGELHNLAETNAERCEQLRDELRDLESKMQLLRSAAVTLSTAERSAFDSLGYIGGRDGPGISEPDKELPDIKDMQIYDNAVHDAEELLAHQQWEPARERLEFALAGASNHPTANIRLGNLLHQLGQEDEAIAAYQRALQLRPGSAIAHSSLAMVYVTRRQWNDALSELHLAQAADPNNAQILFHLGNVLVSAGKPAEAERNFAAAIELDRNYAEAHVNLGTLFQRQGKLSEAVREYQAAVRANPRTFAAHANLGAILAAQGRVQEAIVHWRAAAELKPDEPQIRRELERLEQSLR